MTSAQQTTKRTVWPWQANPGPWSGLLISWLATLMIILVFGLVMLFSASYATGYLRMGNSYYYIRSQTIYAVGGLVMMWVMSHVNYRWVRKLVGVGYVISIALLVAVLFCEPLNGCRRWINIKGLPTLQASELVKFEMILLTAHLICTTPRLRATKSRPITLGRWCRQKLLVELGRPILCLIPVVVLLFLEPHMSGIILMCAIVGTMLLISGSGGVFTYVGAVGGALGLTTLLEHVDSIPYLQSRLDGWTQDLSKMTDQTLQSLYAIGSGGLTGLGLGNSVEKQLWLPESVNDFIFSVVCEELGFVGAMLVILLFVLFIIQGLVLSFEAADLFGTMVGVGIMAQIGWQVFCNIAVVTNTLPNTGISLPFFSSGGTSLVLLLVEMGVLINIARNGEAARVARRQEAMQKKLHPADEAQPIVLADARRERMQPQA
jgi:cell division protein FtsW